MSESIISRTPPVTKHNGLVVLLSHAGRFDTKQLVQGPGARLLDDALSQTKYGRYGIDFRTLACKQPLLPTTKVVLLCGDRAAASIGVPTDKFKAMRGTPIEHNGIIYIPTFHLQDATDKQAYEAANLAQQMQQVATGTETLEMDDDDDDNEDEFDTKEYGRTRRRNYYAWTLLDIRKSCRILTSGIQLNQCQYHLITDLHTGIAVLGNIKTNLPLFLDLETDPDTGRIICIGLSNSSKEVYSISVQPQMYGQVTDHLLVARFFKALSYLLLNCSELIIHNAQFDLFILAQLYRIPPPAITRVYDTMVSHHRLFNGLERSLGHCISLYTDEAYHKDTAIFTPNNNEQLRQLLAYNAKDVERMALVYYRQREIAATIQGAEASIKQGNSSLVPLLAKSLRGMWLDTELLCRTIDDARKRCAILEGKVLAKLAGKCINPRSPTQVATVLYDEIGFPKPPSGHSLTGKKTIYTLALKYPAPILKALVGVRHIAHDASQLSFQIWRKDRVTSGFLTDTDTFRLKSRKLFGRYGTNVQNWPKKMRRVVVAPRGCKLVQVDQRNAEALIVAYLMRPESRYRQLMNHGIKLHTYVTLRLFKEEVWDKQFGTVPSELLNTRIPDLRKHPSWAAVEKAIKESDGNEPSTRYYYMGKQTGLSANYGVGAREFALNTLEKSGGEVFIPHDKAEKFLSIYRTELFPETETQFQDYVKRCATEAGELRNFFGYPKILLDDPKARFDTRYLKSCYAWIPQSTVGTITNVADTNLQLRIDSGELDFMSVLTNTHDALLSCCYEDKVTETIQAMQQEMNQWLTSPFGERFQMLSDASVGDNWYEMREVKT